MSDSFALKAQILEVRRFIFQSETTDKRIISDYEIDYNVSGSRKMTLDGEQFLITEGSMVFRKPGQHGFSVGNYDMYVLSLNFDPNLKLQPENYCRSRRGPIQSAYSHPLLHSIPTCFRPHHKHDYIRIFERLLLNSYPLKENCENQQKLLNEFFLLLNADLYYTVHQGQNHRNTAVEEGCLYINNNFDTDISLEKIATLVHLSPNYFLRLFKNEMGITPKEYLLQIRLEYARSLLSETDLNINILSGKCGFNDASYFSMFFKKRYGITPLEYRRRARPCDRT